MNTFKNWSIRQKLTYSFVGIAILASFLSAAVFLFFLVNNLKKSTQDKILETTKIVFSRTDEVARNLETYSDLISSDMQFGQLLSYDSSLGIQNKIIELQAQSHADYVIFIPKPIQYVQIKDEIFASNEEAKIFSVDVKTWVQNQNFLESSDETLKGWIEFQKRPLIFAAKSVNYFGTNMGVIFLARKMTQSFAKELARAAGAEVIVLTQHGEVVSGSIEAKIESLKSMIESTPAQDRPELIESTAIGAQLFTSLVSSIDNHQKKPVGKLVLMISNASVQEAKKRTILSAVIVAIITAVLSVAIGFILASAVSRPILGITRSIQDISEKDDLSIRVESGTGPEIGILSQSFNKLLSKLQFTTEKLAASERRMKEELTMASTVQDMLFPPRLVEMSSLKLASYIESSSETGGDWYGFSEEKKSNLVSILIGDVTGHGMPAALITAITNGYFKGVFESSHISGADAHAKGLLNTGLLLETLNKILIESTQRQLLMTFFAAVYDQDASVLHYSNAGHLRPFLCRKLAQGYDVSTLASDPGKRLGEDIEVAYVKQTIELKADDILVFYTDGILDCTNKSDEPYGKRRLLQSIKKHIQLDVGELAKNMIADFHHFIGDVPKIDDITLVVAKKIA